MAFIVFAGQSNMGGHGMGPWTRAEAWSPDPLTLIWNGSARAWEPLQPGTNTGYGQEPSAWGPEVQFALDFRAAFPGETLRIVKAAYGGTALYPDEQAWHYDWATTSQDELLDRTAAVIAEAGAAASGIRPDAVLWGQGEEDATNPTAAAAYEQNLTAFIGAVRTEWMGDPNGKVGLFLIGSTPPYSGQVRAAQTAVDGADPNVDSFDTDIFPRQNDALHFAAQGYDLAGSAFFRLYAGWEGAAQPTAPAGQAMNGSPGPDSLTGGPGGDSIAGSWGQDTLRGGEGDDVMSGGDAFDDMVGNQGNDTLAGDAGDDWVVGGKDNDRLYGGDGADIVLGNLGDDTCDGGAEADIVRGGQGDDKLFGWSGNDWLAGDRGNDTVSGGSGADVFHIFADAGIDRVTDFSSAEGDRVQLEPGAAWSAAQVGADTVVTVGAAQLVLAGVAQTSLASGWIFGF